MRGRYGDPARGPGWHAPATPNRQIHVRRSARFRGAGIHHQPSRHRARDCRRRLARRGRRPRAHDRGARPATIGLHRFSLTQLAARLAAPILAAQGLAPVTYLGSEAVAARATFEAQRDAASDVLRAGGDTPGFPRALARTLQELRLAEVRPDRRELPLGGAISRSCSSDSTSSSTRRQRPIARRCSTPADTDALDPFAFAGLPLVLLDVPIDSPVEFDFQSALVRAAPEVLVTVPFGDIATIDRRALGLERELLEQTGATDLVALRRYLFARSQPPVRTPAGDVRSSPRRAKGANASRSRAASSRKRAAACRSTRSRCSCARRQLRRSARARVPPRRTIPAWFDRGTRRPHPAGRAFLAILACACEHLSARRFAEYLSLAQVPALRPAGARRSSRRRTRSSGGVGGCGPRDGDPGTVALERGADERRGGRFNRGRVRHRRGHAARAVEVGDADRRVGGHRRRPSGGTGG